jgi:NAD(P)H-flavin reductase
MGVRCERLTFFSEDGENIIFCIRDRLSKNPYIAPGKKVHLQGPYRYLRYDYRRDKHEYLIAVAGGIGLAPILSIISEINHLQIRSVQKIFIVWIVKYSVMVLPFIYLILMLDEYLADVNIYSLNLDRRESMLVNLYHAVKLEKPNIFELIKSFTKDYPLTKDNTVTICCAAAQLSMETIDACNQFNIKTDNYVCSDFI